jgi:hypothetical protein
MCQKSRLHLYSHCDCEAFCADIDGPKTNCMGFHATFPSLIALWKTIVCLKDIHSEWHSQDYVFGKCQDCGVENLALCPDIHSEWHSRDYVFGKCQDCGVENLALCPVEEEGTSNALVR